MNEQGFTGAWLHLPLAATPWPIQVLVITALAVIGVSIAWWLVVQQNKSTGVSFKKDIWNALKDGNMAVAFYYAARLAVVFGAVAYLMGRFA
jgi:hypothetical protein